eukprot:CAMPEP_0113865154 /NCGR_PEP_ID=MMETSP0372-20130328/17916_1 /TAXON_ID=340204 /ORGANISM="Lankesteria abbotti" /LENGTH=131 /DNA_ID=CAMNT_0000848799 /DNA_START=6 /DNA_END=401 /DNA_ORIENTATION=- /assembly_acc=CAM_ASM_000359
MRFQLDHFTSALTSEADNMNHPHLGIEDFRLHRFLMSHFFYSCRRVLSGVVGDGVVGDGVFVVMSLVEGQFERWDVEAQAVRHGFELTSHVPFVHLSFPFYESRRNVLSKCAHPTPCWTGNAKHDLCFSST